MTPLQIKMMLHIYGIAEPIDNLHDGHSAQRSAITEFLREELITPADCPCAYALTDRGMAYVRFLTSMPLPVANWQIPGPWTPTTPTKGPTP